MIGDKQAVAQEENDWGKC